MSVRRRRLAGTASVFIAALAALASLTAPPANAVEHPSALTHPLFIAHVHGTSVVDLDMVELRPLTLLRRPGESGSIIAHRGDSTLAPENTIPAFLSTTARGADYFEVDVRMTRDAVPVIIHDSTVDRTTDGTGAVSELDLAEVRALDAGSWFSDEFAGTRIPTLAEVLDLAQRTAAQIVIEYKGTWSRADITTTVDMISAAGLDRRIVAQSFSEKTVANFSAVAPDLTIGWLTEELDRASIATAQAIGADAVNPSSATTRTVDLAHRAGLGVFVWTQDADTAWEELTAMGVDGIITNVPGALHEWVRSTEARTEPRTAFVVSADAAHG